MRGEVNLRDVFGIAEQVNTLSYVDRGGLDSELRYALSTERHIAIHGASKQGKSWLRSRVLDDDSFVLVQCQTGTTIESLFTDVLGALGVRAELRRSSANDLEGTLDFRANGSIGLHLLAKLGLETKTGVRGSRSKTIESEPIGQTQANLWWVARTIVAAGKRLVIEDCHYLSDGCLRDLSFILKALSGYGLHVLIAGIWTQDHLLTYYNGDLVGRVEDIHLTWTDDELDKVLLTGGSALNIDMSTQLRHMLIKDAAGNVGLLQQLAEMICREEKVISRQAEALYLTAGPSLQRARQAVATGMRNRFQSFAENFEIAMRETCQDIPPPKTVLREIVTFSDEELLHGIESNTLIKSMHTADGHSHQPQALCQLLERLAEAQTTMGIRPPVLAYNQHAGKVYVADRSLLFFRRYGSPRWPW